MFFWSIQSNVEIDLLIVKGTTKYAYEFKYSQSPKMTKSMHIAMQDLKLDKITIFYPGNLTFPLYEKVTVTNLQDYFKTTGVNWESLT